MSTTAIFEEEMPSDALTASAFIIATLRSNDADDNENVRKTIGLISKTTTSHVHHTFFCTFLARFSATAT